MPGLVGSTNMPILNAVGTSLVAVTAFGLTTSFNYALSGMVDWNLAFVFIAGGISWAACSAPRSPNGWPAKPAG